jgi:hypothetical protein
MLLESKRQNHIDAILAQGGSVILMSHLGGQGVEEKTIEAYFEDNFSSSGSSGDLFLTVLRS